MFKYLKKYWILVILAPIFMMGEVFMDLLQPRYMSRIIDEGVLGLSNNGVGDLNLVFSLGLKMIILVLIGGASGVICGIFANTAAQKIGNDIRKDTFKKIMSFSFEQTDKFTTGSLITRVTNDITQIQNFIQMSFRGLVRTSFLIIGGVFCMLSLHFSFGMVVVCAMPFIITCVVYFISKANPLFTKLQEKLDKLNNVLQENVSGARVVKANVREEYEINRFERANDDLVQMQLNVLLLLAFMSPIMNIILNVSVVAVIKLGQINVNANIVTPGNVMAAITYVSQVLNALMRMTMIFQNISRGMASVKRVNEVLVCDVKLVDGSIDKNNDTSKVKGKVEFKNVSFAYPGMESNTIIDDFNLVINPGETIGILGATGSGKTSLINLIPRFYDVLKGEVLVDDIDVREYKLSYLREKIAVAAQKSELFSVSIKENIAWGKKDASMEMIKEAADIAQATSFIELKPDGFDTLVYQGGASLSGGQRQRISIARTILKNSEILILDDATSALDLKTEADLYKELDKKQGNLTKIIVAQRIASVKNADRIVIIDNGRLMAVGKHEELLKTSDIYKDIYDSQLKNED